MDINNLTRGNQIQERINEIENDIKVLIYARRGETTQRDSDIKFYGIESTITAPKSIFRTISQLVLSELNQELLLLKDEFDKL